MTYEGKPPHAATFENLRHNSELGTHESDLPAKSAAASGTRSALCLSDPFHNHLGELFLV
jgi:hypothetical protein